MKQEWELHFIISSSFSYMATLSKLDIDIQIPHSYKFYFGLHLYFLKINSLFHIPLDRCNIFIYVWIQCSLEVRHFLKVILASDEVCKCNHFEGHRLMRCVTSIYTFILFYMYIIEGLLNWKIYVQVNSSYLKNNIQYSSLIVILFVMHDRKMF